MMNSKLQILFQINIKRVGVHHNMHQQYQTATSQEHLTLQLHRGYRRTHHKELSMTTANKSRRIIILTFLFLVTFICFIPVTMVAPTSVQKYTYGFKLYQYNLEPGDSVADNPIPKAELGSFVAKKSEFTYIEAEKIIGIPINTARLYRAMGYLNVKKPGAYTIITTSQGSRKYGCIFVNKKLAISNRNSPFALTAPVYFSEPGCYEVDIRIYDFINRDLVVPNGYSYAPSAKFNFFIKTPDNDKPQPAHKVLLLPLR